MPDDLSVATNRDFGHRYWRSTRSVPQPLGDLDTGDLDDATFRLLAENLPTLCWIANGDGYIVWYNRRWHEYCGTTPADMEGWGWQTVHDPVLLPTVMARWQDAIAAGEPFEMVFPLRGADGVFRPFLTRISPVRDATGTVKRWCGVNTEISDQVAAETALRAEQAALRTSEARLEAIFANASVGLSEVAPDGCFLRVNGELCRILGRTRDELLSLGVADVTFPADIPASLAAMTAASGTGRSAALDKRYCRPDGNMVWANSTVTELPRVDDQPGRLLVVTVDLSERRGAEQALRESEERLRLAVEVGALALWDWNMVTREIAWSDEHYLIHGYAVGEVVPSFETWAARVHPDDFPHVEAALLRARTSRADYVHEFRARHPDGEIRWCAARGRFFYDDTGKAVRMIGVMIDVTERRAWEDTQTVLLAELQHRTRNLLAVVGAVASRTLAGSATLADFRGRFMARLDALSRVNGLLSRLADGARISFDELIRAELAAHGVIDEEGRGPQIALEGPRGVRLRSTTAQIFALGLHELATNALKHGALSHPEGLLLVRWRLTEEDGAQRLEVEWQESGVAVAPATTDSAIRHGYGRELIERALPYQLKARVDYRLEPDGARCTISVPVATQA